MATEINTTSADTETNTFEAERQANIQRNKALLRELKLEPLLKDVPKISSSDRKGPSSKRRKFDNLPPPTRSSARISAGPRPSYNDDTILYVLEEPKRKAASSSSSSSRRTKHKLKSDYDNDTEVELPPDKALPAEKDDIIASWKWESTAPPPTRDDINGYLNFSDFPDFTPNKTPEEIIREGCFGGSYYRPLYSRKLGFTIVDDHLELPTSWTQDLNLDSYLTSPLYNPDINKYKVACGQTIEEWEEAGWIDHRYDVRGWLQWYIRFYLGRRCGDDQRQISRWRKCVGKTGRFRRALLKKYVTMGVKEVFDDGEDEETKEVSPVVHQTCHHWAFEVRQGILDEFWETGQ